MSRIPIVDPKPGDLIEFDRISYQHWAVYIGNGYVVHLVAESTVPEASLASVTTEHAKVKMEPLQTVAGIDNYKINNKYDERYPWLPVRTIISKAMEKVGTVMKYDLLTYNCEHFATELRYDIPVSDQVDPKLGDLIEFDRNIYQHWAVYIGNGYVVHLTAENEVPQAGFFKFASVTTEHAKVKMEPLQTVAGIGNYKINNKYDERYPWLPVRTIISKAMEKVGTVMKYDLLKYNCEHFATELRHDKPVSDQADKLCEAARNQDIVTTIWNGVKATGRRLLWGGQ